MGYKKFVPCMYLYKGMVVKDFTDMTPLNMNPAELAKFYNDNNADELLIFDLSKGDLEHEEALGIIKHIAGSIEIPVIGAGNVQRMEDIKKLLYAGCTKAVLNFSKEDNIALLEEVSKKFGKEKIVASLISETELEQNKEQLEQYAGELLSMDVSSIKNILALTEIPVLSMIPEVSLDKMMELLAIDYVSGLTGTIVNENAKEIHALKTLCTERGISVSSYENIMKWSEFTLNSDGMVPVIVQDYKTNEVLMMAYMNEEAYQNTLRTGKMTYYSRSRQELWIKGATSGHYQYVKALTSDCDNDTILAKVSQVGAACHTGNYSCFFHEIMKKEYDDTNPLKVLEDVLSVIKDRKINPKDGSYTNYLFEKGLDKILKKLGEEATEIVIASKNPNPEEIKYEIADFLYHMMVLMVDKGITWKEITAELSHR